MQLKNGTKKVDVNETGDFDNEDAEVQPATVDVLIPEDDNNPVSLEPSKADMFYKDENIDVTVSLEQGSVRYKILSHDGTTLPVVSKLKNNYLCPNALLE